LAAACLAEALLVPPVGGPTTPAPNLAAAATSTDGHGLRARYFDTESLTGLKLTRTDPTVNFAWGSGSPVRSIAPNTFSARWQGELQVRRTAPTPSTRARATARGCGSTGSG